MSKQFKFVLSTPDSVLYNGEVEEVVIPTPDGEIGIMADHMPLVSLIAAGVMTIKSGKEEKNLATGSGFIRATAEKVEVFAQTAEFAESIDEQRALKAKQEAQAIITEKKDEISLADATSLLERNIARIKVLERKKHRTHGN